VRLGNPLIQPCGSAQIVVVMSIAAFSFMTVPNATLASSRFSIWLSSAAKVEQRRCALLMTKSHLQSRHRKRCALASSNHDNLATSCEIEEATPCGKGAKSAASASLRTRVHM
jgi:hypothetical protein